jgi:hypothetical protein
MMDQVIERYLLYLVDVGLGAITKGGSVKSGGGITERSGDLLKQT